VQLPYRTDSGLADSHGLVAPLIEHVSATKLAKLWLAVCNLAHPSGRVAMEQLLQAGVLSPATVMAELLTQTFESDIYR
jgi:hypothetical protein